MLGHLNWCEKGITVLSESIGNLTVDGDLAVEWNTLESLPESFGSPTVGGKLYLRND